MKRKFSDRANWRRIVNRTYSCRTCREDEFTGLVTYYHIHKLRDPLMKAYKGKKLCLADENYLWLQHFPARERFVVTTMFDDKGHVVQWYIDICRKQGTTDQGVPWFDDLYLDIVVLPSGEVMLLDEDELEDAVKSGEITRNEAEDATEIANKLMALIEAGDFPYFDLSLRNYKQWKLDQDKRT